MYSIKDFIASKLSEGAWECRRLNWEGRCLHPNALLHKKCFEMHCGRMQPLWDEARVHQDCERDGWECTARWCSRGISPLRFLQQELGRNQSPTTREEMSAGRLKNHHWCSIMSLFSVRKVDIKGSWSTDSTSVIKPNFKWKKDARTWPLLFFILQWFVRGGVVWLIVTSSSTWSVQDFVFPNVKNQPFIHTSIGGATVFS